MKKLVDGIYVDLTDHEVAEITAARAEHENLAIARKATRVRSQRDALLQETDWIVIKSYERGEHIPAEWELYRQALRDITTQAGFPYEVTWPTKP